MRYVTLEDGIDFRQIAHSMTAAGHRMNHATARNVLMSSLVNLFNNISEEVGVEVTTSQLEEILKDQSVHEALGEILSEAYVPTNGEANA